jgi:hypothetical protein
MEDSLPQTTFHQRCGCVVRVSDCRLWSPGIMRFDLVMPVLISLEYGLRVLDSDNFI